MLKLVVHKVKRLIISSANQDALLIYSRPVYGQWNWGSAEILLGIKFRKDEGDGRNPRHF